MSNYKLVGLTGPIASGKGVLGDYLVDELGWNYISLSGLVREEARRRNIAEERENLINIGNSLRAERGPGVLGELAYEKMLAKEYQNVVVDGIRNPGEIHVLRNQSNYKVLIIGVNAEAEIRYKRALERARDSDPITLDHIRKIDKKDRAIGIEGCLEIADILIYNHEHISMEELVSNFKDILAEKGF